MIRSERRACKAIAEYLALISDAHHSPHRLDSIREADEELWECATEFSTAIEKFWAERTISSLQSKRAAERAMRLVRTSHCGSAVRISHIGRGQVRRKIAYKNRCSREHRSSRTLKQDGCSAQITRPHSSGISSATTAGR